MSEAKLAEDLTLQGQNVMKMGNFVVIWPTETGVKRKISEYVLSLDPNDATVFQLISFFYGVSSVCCGRINKILIFLPLMMFNNLLQSRIP